MKRITTTIAALAAVTSLWLAVWTVTHEGDVLGGLGFLVVTTLIVLIVAANGEAT